jgi:hypothetical protein
VLRPQRRCRAICTDTHEGGDFTPSRFAEARAHPRGWDVLDEDANDSTDPSGELHDWPPPRLRIESLGVVIPKVSDLGSNPVEAWAAHEFQPRTRLRPSLFPTVFGSEEVTRECVVLPLRAGHEEEVDERACVEGEGLKESGLMQPRQGWAQIQAQPGQLTSCGEELMNLGEQTIMREGDEFGIASLSHMDKVPVGTAGSLGLLTRRARSGRAAARHPGEGF